MSMPCYRNLSSKQCHRYLLSHAHHNSSSDIGADVKPSNFPPPWQKRRFALLHTTKNRITTLTAMRSTPMLHSCDQSHSLASSTTFLGNAVPLQISLVAEPSRQIDRGQTDRYSPRHGTVKRILFSGTCGATWSGCARSCCQRPCGRS